jgi:hypothetical protein
MLTCDTQSLTTNGLTDFPIVGPSWLLCTKDSFKFDNNIIKTKEKRGN